MGDAGYCVCHNGLVQVYGTTSDMLIQRGLGVTDAQRRGMYTRETLLEWKTCFFVDGYAL